MPNVGFAVNSYSEKYQAPSRNKIRPIQRLNSISSGFVIIRYLYLQMIFIAYLFASINLLRIAAISARVALSCGFIVVSVLPFINPVFTAQVIAVIA